MPKKNQNLKELSVFLIPIAVLSVLGVFLYMNQSANADQLGQKALAFLNDNILPEGVTASLIDITKEGEVYKIRLDVQGTEYESYISKDGKYLFPDGYNLESLGQNGTQAQIEKRDVPDFKLFVMSYCPYGLQVQKAYLSVYDLLKDKVEMGVYFVDYIMHGKKEIDENLVQLCIQKEQRAQYDDYLSCFVKDGDSETCLSEAGIDQETLSSCIDQIDQEFSIYDQYANESTWVNGQYPKFDVQKSLNDAYGVEGSPTVVINDQIVGLNSRSPEALKQAICSGFAEAPEECSVTLSDVAFSDGFGLEEGSSNNQGCGQ